jgi:hypothetical protein
MPGLGAVLTFTLIALLPELGKMSRKQIAVLRLEGTTFPDMAANARRVVFLSPTESRRPPFRFRYAQEVDLKVSALASGAKGPRPTDTCTAASSRFLSITSSASASRLAGTSRPISRHTRIATTSSLTSTPRSFPDPRTSI